MDKNGLIDHDLYDFLGVDNTAGHAEIKKSYRALCLKMHPDKAGNTPENNEKFARLHEAWEVLGDPRRRAVYDIRWHERHRNTESTSHKERSCTKQGLQGNRPKPTGSAQAKARQAKASVLWEIKTQEREASAILEDLYHARSMMELNMTTWGLKFRSRGFWIGLSRDMDSSMRLLLDKGGILKFQVEMTRHGTDSHNAKCLLREIRWFHDALAPLSSVASKTLNAMDKLAKCLEGEDKRREALLKEVEWFLRSWGPRNVWGQIMGMRR